MINRSHLTRLAFPALLLLSVTASGCIEEARVFYIRQNQVPTSGCQVTTTTSIYQPDGLLDVSVNQGYWLFPLLENALKASGGSDGEPERNALNMKGYEVTIDLQQLTDVVQYDTKLLKFWVPTSGFIGPGGKLAGRLKVIPDLLAKAIAEHVKAQYKGDWPIIYVTVTAVAYKVGSEVESSAFVYPIQLCNECLVNKRTTCPTDPSKDKTVVFNTCGFPQDEPVTCCWSKTKGFGCYKKN